MEPRNLAPADGGGGSRQGPAAGGEAELPCLGACKAEPSPTPRPLQKPLWLWLEELGK